MKILCSSIILENGLMLCGWRHPSCIHKIKEIYGKPQKIKEQGFLTSEGKFVDRKKALDIAIKAEQYKPFENIKHNILFSEDLY